MTLQKAKKTIQLYGGISDDVDSFLVPSPAVEYAENCHWRGKEGKLVKRLGSVQATATNAPSGTELPTVLHALGDNLYTVNGSSTYKYDVTNDSWTSKSQLKYYATNERAARTPIINGIDHHSAIRLNDYEVIAYSVKNKPLGYGIDTDEFHTYVRTYYQGSLIAEKEITAATPAGTTDISGPRAPYLIADLTSVTVVYGDASSSTSGKKAIYRRDITLSTGALGSATLIADDVHDSSFEYKQRDYDSTTTYSQSIPYASGCVGGHLWFCVSGAESLSSKFALAYTDGTSFDLKVKQSSDRFATIDNTATVTASGSFTFNRPLACYADTDVDRLNGVTVLYSSYTDDTSSGRVYVRGWDWGSATTQWSTTIVDTAGAAADKPLLSTASMCANESGSLYWAVSGYGEFYSTTSGAVDANGSPILRYEPGTTIGYFDIATRAVAYERNLYGHRLSTNLAYTNSSMFVGVQQWNVLWDRTSAGAWAKPVTNMLANVALFPLSGTTSATTALDPGESKHTDATESFNNQHLGSLRPYDSGATLMVSTRQVVRTEDVSGGQSGSALAIAPRELVSGEGRINLYDVTLSSTAQLPGVALGDGLVIPASTPLWFDGEVLAELSPLDSPEISAVMDPNQTLPLNYYYGATVLSTGSSPRLMQAVCGYVDVKGNTHRSAPSTLLWVYGIDPRDSSGTDNDWLQGKNLIVDINVPLSMNQTGTAGRYFVELYISDNATSVPKLAQKLHYTTGNGRAVMYTTNSAVKDTPDSTSEALIRNTPFIYTGGDVLAADPWVYTTQNVVTSTRLWGIAEDGRVFYSKLFEEFVAPEFNASLSVSLGDERRLTAIGKLDDKVVVFEKNDIHVIYGPGPDNTGNTGRAGGFDVHHITSDVGCNDQNSVVEISQGLIFKSRRGFYLLDRNLTLHFIGGGVKDITRNTRVTAAQLVPEFAEVRFHLAVQSGESQVPATGPDADAGIENARPARPKFGNVLPTDGCVVYNYELGRWTVFSDYPAACATLTSDGKYARILDDWTLFIEASEEDDVWMDGTDPYYMKIITPHIPLADTVQGYSRCRRITAVGRYMSSWGADSAGNIMAGDIQITPRYDYETTDGTARLWRANEELQGGNDRLQIQLRPGRQKCQAIQLTIEEVATTAYTVPDNTYGSGRGFEIVAVEFDLGIKDGPVRTLGAKRKQ